MPPDEQQDKTFFQEVADWIGDVVEWVKTTFADPGVRAAVLADLGIDDDGSEATDPALLDQLDGQAQSVRDYASKRLDQADEEAFAVVVDDIVTLVTAIKDIVEHVDSGADGLAVAREVLTVASVRHLRYRLPIVYAIARLAGIVIDDERGADILWDALGDVFTDPFSNFSGMETSEDALALSNSGFGGLLAGLMLLDEFDEFEPMELEGLYGWEGDPSNDPPAARDEVASRTLTVGVRTKSGERLTVSMALVPREHSGPGMMLGLGGSVDVEYDTLAGPNARPRHIVFEVSAGTAVSAFLPFADDAAEFALGGPGSLTFELRREPQPGSDEAPIIIGNAGGTRLELTRPAYRFTIGDNGWGVGVGLEGSKLVIGAGSGDSFLAEILGGQDIELDFDLRVGVDGESGFYIDGGTSLMATLPINEGFAGITIQHLTIGLAAGDAGTSSAFALEASVSLKTEFGPFTASVDRLGFLLGVDLGEGNLGLLDVAPAFKPPNGIGLLLDFEVVKGGGFLFLDHERGEYAGALELKLGPVGIKAIGLLTTRLPDGGDGWALFLMVYGEFPPIQLGYGFTLNKVGGMFGLQHSVSTDALQSNLASGVMDDVLFPADPVGDAPRILNQLRTVFPVTRDRLVLGPIFEIGWGAPTLIHVRLGIVVDFDIGDQGGLEQVVLLGQIRAEVPTEDLGLLRLIIDILGQMSWRDDTFQLRIFAQLRDSKIGQFELTGSMALEIVSGPEDTFILSAGGFHPEYDQVPDSLPDMKRIGFKIKKGPARITLGGYFAVTSNTVQAGARLDVVVKKSGVGLEAWLGFDTLFVFDPKFEFRADLYAGAKIKFKGHTLMGVDLKLTLWGPAPWRAKGSATFEILFWDVTVGFDKTWGDRHDDPLPGVEAGPLVRQALERRENWAAQLPAGGDMLVSLRQLNPTEDEVLAHPLGELTVRQKIVPFGVEVDRIGKARPTDARRFDITSATFGTVSDDAPPRVKDQFAPAQYFEMDEHDKLNARSFERMESGVTFSAAGTTFGTAQDAELGYETIILRRAREWRLPGVFRVNHDSVATMAKVGAVGMSAVQADRARARDLADDLRVEVEEPAFAVAGTDDLRATDGRAAMTWTEAMTEVRARDGGVQVVEAHEAVVG